MIEKMESEIMMLEAELSRITDNGSRDWIIGKIEGIRWAIELAGRLDID